MKLKQRTTYRTKGGAVVHIAGFARHEPIEGQAIYWSIGGDWYAEDGRMVWGSVERDGDIETYRRFLLPPDSDRTIAAEAHDPHWWEGVKTESVSDAPETA